MGGHSPSYCDGTRSVPTTESPWPRQQQASKIADEETSTFWFFGPSVLVFPTGANWIRPDAEKRKWRAVVDQLATLKADHNVTCREQSRPGCLTRVATDCGL